MALEAVFLQQGLNALGIGVGLRSRGSNVIGAGRKEPPPRPRPRRFPMLSLPIAAWRPALSACKVVLPPDFWKHTFSHNSSRCQ